MDPLGRRPVALSGRELGTLRLPAQSASGLQDQAYDYDAHRYNENRLMPLGLSFRVNRHALFTTYYMLWSQRGSETWRHSHVLGTQLSLSF